MLLGFIPIEYMVDHIDVIVNVGLWRLTYMLLPSEQRGHFRRGVRVIRATRVCVSRTEKFFFAIRLYQVEGLVERAEEEVRHVVHEVRESDQGRVESETSETKVYRIELF